MDLAILTSVVLIVSSVIGTSTLVVFFLSSRFRISFVRRLLNDYAKLLTYSQMGHASGDKRFQSKVESILTDAVPHLIARVASDNPVIQVVLDYLLNETEIGDLLSDPRTLPIVMSFAQKNLQGAGLSDMLGSLTKQQKDDITDGFRIG